MLRFSSKVQLLITSVIVDTKSNLKTNEWLQLKIWQDIKNKYFRNIPPD